jgi:hypothetical protein
MQPLPRRGQNKSGQGNALRERDNPTTEAKWNDNVVIIQNEEPVAVAANSGVDSPLDKRDKPPCGAPGRSSAHLSPPPPRAPGTPRPDAGPSFQARPHSTARSSSCVPSMRSFVACPCPVHTRARQTQRPSARRSTWTNALRGEKSATFGHFGPRSEAIADRSVPFSNRCITRIYVIIMRPVRFKNPVGRLGSPSEHSRSKVLLQKVHDNGPGRAGSAFPTNVLRTKTNSTCNGSAGWHPSAARRERAHL